MRSWVNTLLLLVLSVLTVQALEVRLDETADNDQRCSGMYSKSAWGGPVDPFILIKFTDVGKDMGDDPIVSLVVFEWMDEDYIGVTPPGAAVKDYICKPEYVEAGFCNETDIGEFILAPNATEKSTNVILTKAMHLKDSVPIKYPITKTGYYCVIAYPYTASKFEALTEFRNAYGELPAAQIPKLPFYGGITILYALVLVFWGFLYFHHRSDILAVQNYITAILIFLVVEMLMTWGFYDYLNRNGSNMGSRVLLIVVAILNAVRNSFSFFLLLIVCMGYGVVKPTLGRTMIYVRFLAIAHFVFGLIYAITSLLVTPDTAGPFVLLIVLPLAGTLTAFYVWTLNSLNFTLKDLRERKQHVKETMYKKLWWCILLSIIVIFAFFFFNSFSFASASDPDYVPFHWKSRWFILDGWLNLVYFADVAWIAYVWRPTANNRRFAMSDEIAQEDDGTFEIANLDIGAPDDSDDDEEARVGSKPAGQNGNGTSGAAPPPAAAPQRTQSQRTTTQSQTQAAQSSQQQQQARHEPPRDSLDGETIFAVGEDGDKFSDDEGSGEESGLVRGRK
ncbi:lung seven transmembrane receptor-domain-containing protein [Diplogelasinospora grovesii]|uniref:Lung seven transmembrane receptor-domain-containing protein n=1 Tax=Diplogelasinospora grovesii TaxID=303347 RepID=A0AAN6NEE8_9PEZI|nr:lung seven transmembrane receptor-domain-containing protein [Diplogelasinospora grovesii]